MTYSMRAKRLLALVALLSIFISLVSCASPVPARATPTNPIGSPQATPSISAPKASATSPRASATSSEPTQASSADIVTITYAGNFFPDQLAAYQPLVDEFQKENPAIKIVPFSLFDHQINLPSEIARQADIIVMSANLAFTPGFLNLQPLVDASPDFNIQDFWPGITSACSDSDGNPYGIPLNYSPVGVYYDPQLIDQVHAQPPRPGWTWAQFFQTIDQVSGTDADGKVTYGFVDGFARSILEPTLYRLLQSSGGLIDPKTITAGIDWYLRLVKEKKLWPVQTSNMVPIEGEPGKAAGKWNPLLDDGQGAMWLGSPISPMATVYPGLPGSDSKTGVFVHFPTDLAEDKTSPAIVSCAAISAGSQHRQAAWAWLDYLSHHDLSGSLGGQLPARQSLAKTSQFWLSLSPMDWDSIQFALEHGLYAYDNVASMLFTLSDAIDSGKDVADELGKIAERTGSTQSIPTLEPFVVNTLPAPQSAEVQSIAFNSGFWVGVAKGGLDGLIADFEKLHPDISVKIVDNNPSTDDPTNPDYGHDLRNLARNYDCFEYPRPELEPLSSNDLLDLTPWMDASPDLKGDFYPAFLAPFEKDGKLYALPTGTTIQYIAYNADLLTRLGLPFPTSGWTFDEMLSLAAQAANPTASTPIYGLAADPGSLLSASGVHWYDSTVQPPKALFNTDGVAKGLAWLDQLYRKGTLFTPGNSQDYWQKITSGQVALWVTNGFEANNQDGKIYDQSMPFKVGYAPVPSTSSGGMFGYPASSMGYYISSQTTHAQACWTWIQYLSEQPGVFGGYTPRKTVLEKEFVGLSQDQFAVVKTTFEHYQAGDYADTGQSNPLLRPYLFEWNAAQTAVLQGKDISTVLAEAQNKSDAYLACIAQKNLTGLDAIQVYYLAVKSCYAGLP